MQQKTKNRILAISIGLVYLWFGTLKFFPEASPAETLAKNTIHELTFGFIPDNISIILLAIWETGIGILLVAGKRQRAVVLLALVHMMLTFTPLLFFPDDTFNGGPLQLTFVGQYIIKNLIIIAALVTLLDVDFQTVLDKTRLKSKNLGTWPLFLSWFRWAPAKMYQKPPREKV